MAGELAHRSSGTGSGRWPAASGRSSSRPPPAGAHRVLRAARVAMVHAPTDPPAAYRCGSAPGHRRGRGVAPDRLLPLRRLPLLHRPAGPLNKLSPTATTGRNEQPGCLHATMDLYKHAFRLGPFTPGSSWLTASNSRATCARSTCARRLMISRLGLDRSDRDRRTGSASTPRVQRAFAGRAAPLRDRWSRPATRCSPA